MWYLLFSSIFALAAYDFFYIIKKDNETNYQKICQLHAELKKINRKRYEAVKELDNEPSFIKKILISAKSSFQLINNKPQIVKFKTYFSLICNTYLSIFFFELRLEMQTLHDTVSCIVQMKWEHFIIRYCTPQQQNLSVQQLSNDRVAITYKIGVGTYKVVLPVTQTNKFKSSKILNITGEIREGHITHHNVKNDILPYFGPDEDGYKMRVLTPCLLGYNELTFTYLSAKGIDLTTFKHDDLIVLNE